MKSMTLTDDETRRYDNDDPHIMRDIRERAGREAREAGEDRTEVYHPHGFVVAIVDQNGRASA